MRKRTQAARQLKISIAKRVEKLERDVDLISLDARLRQLSTRVAELEQEREERARPGR